MKNKYTIAGIILTLYSSGFGGIIVWAGNTQWVTHEAMRQYATEDRIQTISDKLFILELKKPEDLTQIEKAILKRYTREHEKLLKKRGQK